MREYGQVQTAFWTHPDVARLGDGAKLLAVYLFTCPHSNALGCFRVPAGYISADLGWTEAAVEAHLDELERAGLVLSDPASGWRLVPNHLKWNPIQNPNVGKAVVRQARAVPAGFPHRGRMVEALGRFGSHLPEGWAKTAGGESRPRPFDVEGAFAAFLAAYPGGAALGPAWRVARGARGLRAGGLDAARGRSFAKRGGKLRRPAHAFGRESRTRRPVDRERALERGRQRRGRRALAGGKGMRSWQDRGMPYHGSRYTAQTHHAYWDGERHYWTGMAVKGMEDQDPDNPLCCPDLALYEGEEVTAGPGTLQGLRAAMKRAGLSHRVAAERLRVGVTSVRQRLYGRRPFARAEFNRLCRMAEIDPDRLLEGSRGEARG